MWGKCCKDASFTFSQGQAIGKGFLSTTAKYHKLKIITNPEINWGKPHFQGRITPSQQGGKRLHEPMLNPRVQESLDVSMDAFLRVTAEGYQLIYSGQCSPSVHSLLHWNGKHKLAAAVSAQRPPSAAELPPRRVPQPCPEALPSPAPAHSQLCSSSDARAGGSCSPFPSHLPASENGIFSACTTATRWGHRTNNPAQVTAVTSFSQDLSLSWCSLHQRNTAG